MAPIITHTLSASKILKNAQRIVIKIGSALLIQGKNNTLNTHWMKTLSQDIQKAHSEGKDIIIVSSGAVALGRSILPLPNGTLQLAQKQAAAAAGQIILCHAWKEGLGKHNINIAQILLTLDNTENRNRYLNAQTTLRTLLNYRAVPIINENDTVATEEIRYGDNDRLAAKVANMISADCLVLLSDIDGFYTADPNKNNDAKHMPIIEKITPEIHDMAGDSANIFVGSGGMKTKLLAAEITQNSGTHMILANGLAEHPIERILSGNKCTLFPSPINPISAHKHWISSSLNITGKLYIDAETTTAIKEEGANLLAMGVKKIDGEFSRGDCVSIYNENNQEIARALIECSTLDAKSITGKEPVEIKREYPELNYGVICYSDNLIML